MRESPGMVERETEPPMVAVPPTLSYGAFDLIRPALEGAVENMTHPDIAKAVGRAYMTTAIETHDASRRLIHDARALAKHMTALAAEVEARPFTASVNPLGEVQSLGSMVDAACGAFVARREAMLSLEGIGGKVKRQ